MLKFKSLAGFRAEAAKLPAVHNGDTIFLCVDFTNDIGQVFHKAVVTAEELHTQFKGHCWGVTITGYRTTEEVAGLTLEERGLPEKAALTKPETVPSPIWNDLNEGQKLWIIEHERLHEEHRRKVIAAKAAIESVYADLAK